MVRFALLLVASCVAAASALLPSSIAQCHRAPRQLGRRVPVVARTTKEDGKGVVARSTKEDGKGEAMDLDLNQMQEMFDAAAADGAPPAPAKPEINSGLDVRPIVGTCVCVLSERSSDKRTPLPSLPTRRLSPVRRARATPPAVPTLLLSCAPSSSARR